MTQEKQIRELLEKARKKTENLSPAGIGYPLYKEKKLIAIITEILALLPNECGTCEGSKKKIATGCWGMVHKEIPSSDCPPEAAMTACTECDKMFVVDNPSQRICPGCQEPAKQSELNNPQLIEVLKVDLEKYRVGEMLKYEPVRYIVYWLCDRLKAESKRATEYKRLNNCTIELLNTANEERDLAIAHDRQLYPTTEAYEKACAALHKKGEALTMARGYIGEGDSTAIAIQGDIDQALSGDKNNEATDPTTSN